MKTKCPVKAADRKEITFLEALMRRCPHDVEVLKALGELYTRAGRYEDGLKTDLELSRLLPGEALVWYNLACSYALVNRTDAALTALERSVVLGYRDTRWMWEDSDLAALRQDERFIALLQRLVP